MFKGLLATYKTVLKARPADLLKALEMQFKAHAYSENGLSRQICQRTCMVLASWLQTYFAVDFAKEDKSDEEQSKNTLDQQAVRQKNLPWLQQLFEANQGRIPFMTAQVLSFVEDMSASPLKSNASALAETLKVRSFSGICG